MKNKILLGVYVLAALVIADVLLEEILRYTFLVGILDDDTLMFGAFIIGGIAGIFAYLRSFKVLRYKILAALLVAAIPWIFSFTSYCTGECMLPLIAIMVSAPAFLYIVLLTASTFIARKLA